MDELHYLDVISGRRRGVAAELVRGALALGIPAYGAAVICRNWLFDRRLRRMHRVSVPVVSVGNLTTGGTGKTPVVAELAAWFRSRGVRPCLVSRGYRSLDPVGNDELRVLAQLCPGIPHVQHRDRVTAAGDAVRLHKAEMLILDDGFQHRRLARDLDLVLLDATNPWGYGHLLPRGLLREPKSALRRAGLVLLTRVDQVTGEVLTSLKQEVAGRTDAPLVTVRFAPTGVLSRSGTAAQLSTLAGQRIAAFCGIGNPNGFRRTLSQAGLAVSNESFTTFADHHHYTSRQLRDLADRARSRGAAALVTTHKDLVKLDPAWESGLPVWALMIGVEFVTGRENWERTLSRFVPESPGC